MKSQYLENPEAVCDLRVDFEELLAVTAQDLNSNHNETFLGAPVESVIEVLLRAIACGLNSNHNETFVAER